MKLRFFATTDRTLCTPAIFFDNWSGLKNSYTKWDAGFQILFWKIGFGWKNDPSPRTFMKTDKLAFFGAITFWLLAAGFVGVVLLWLLLPSAHGETWTVNGRTYLSNSIPDPSAVATVTTVTNWTGVITQGRELGYLFTNHDLRVCYQRTTNTIQAKRELSSVAVWREQVHMTFSTNVNTQNIQWFIPTYGDKMPVQ